MTVVTANRRLARDLRDQHNDEQIAASLQAWPAPQIMSWSAWLNGTLEESYPEETLLSTPQELAIWQGILSGTPLLDVPATARACSEAWALIREWRLPLDHPSWQYAEDTAVFLKWATQFQSTLRRRRWIEPAAMPDMVQFSSPQRIELRGFDELTPQQEEVIARLIAAGGEANRVTARSASPGRAIRSSMADAHAEIEAAAVWARRWIEERGLQRIGIVVPDLDTSTRPRIEHMFRAIFGSESAFNISLGWPLIQSPIVHASLLILKASQQNLQIAEADQLLRSPFIRGAWDDPFTRAKDALALREGELEVQAHALAQTCEVFKNWPTPGANRTPSQWTEFFKALLKKSGWPGDRGLDSSEYQAMKSWNAVLSEFAALDAATGSISGQEAHSYLRRMAAEREFQPETQPAPVQILGVLEAAGSTFDAMWVMGMHDGVWPAPARPNPFIPIALHRELNLPHSSAKRELEFASQAMRRLLESAGEIVFSYPRMDGDRELGPSPLILSFPEEQLPFDAPRTFRHVIHESAKFEEFIDEHAPPVPENQWQRGGSRLLKLQAACPFRAFAEIRLRAGDLEEPVSGLDPLTRGTILHNALKYLPDMPAEEAVDRALEEDGMRHPESPGFWRVERTRLESLLKEWQDFDTPRTIVATELTRPVELGGLKLDIRIDRIDRTADGKTVLLDYKTTAPSASSCHPPRPDEPQLPLYAITMPEAPDAIAFAQVKRGDMKFCGFVREDGILGKLHPSKTTDWTTQIADWREALEALALEFRAGRAAVDPKNDATCDGCPIIALCRIQETRA
jgi:ATP-dependent helicase/nuclease subunit B